MSVMITEKNSEMLANSPTFEAPDLILFLISSEFSEDLWKFFVLHASCAIKLSDELDCVSIIVYNINFL